MTFDTIQTIEKDYNIYIKQTGRERPSEKLKGKK